MEYDGKGRGLEGFGPSGRFAPELPFGDQKRFLADYRDPSRALAFLQELSLKVTKESLMLAPTLVSLVKHDAAVVVRQCIIRGTGFFCAVLEEIAQQIHNSGMIERWLEDVWSWMLKFKDAVCGVVVEHGSAGARMLAVKFLEVFVLLFSSEPTDNDRTFTEGYVQRFNISRLIGSHPILDSGYIAFETKKCLDFFLSLLKLTGTFPGSLTIVIINCLANIARKRPAHYNCILSALMAFDPDYDNMKGGHAGSARYSLRTAFLGFLRCMNHPSIVDSRDKLLWALRSMNPGESTEQMIRQADKMSKNIDRGARETRFSKDEMATKQVAAPGDFSTKKILPENDCSIITDETPSKRVRYDATDNSLYPQLANDPHDNGEGDPVDGFFLKDFVLDSSLPAVEQMIAMIGAMIAQGEKGAASLQLLISKIQPELLADMVIVNMKHLPSSPLSSVTKLGNAPDSSQTTSDMAIAGPTAVDTSSIHPSGTPSQLPSTVSTSGITAIASDTSSMPSTVVDSKRDPRRDPRRLDPRRFVAPVRSDTMPSSADTATDVHPTLDNAQSRPAVDTAMAKVDISSVSSIEEHHIKSPEGPVSSTNQLASPEGSAIFSEHSDVVLSSDLPTSMESLALPVPVLQDMHESTYVVVNTNEVVDADMMESDKPRPAVSSIVASEQTSDLPLVPPYIELSDKQTNLLAASAILKVIEVHKQMPTRECAHVCLSLLPRLVAQRHDSDEIIAMLQKHILLDYQHNKGHELVLHVLYHLRAIMVSEEHESPFACVIYEKFLLAVAKSLREFLPASDKSFSRLLGEVPFLPESALKLLEDLCQTPSSDQHVKDAFEGDRVTQGLGTVWSLILVRPSVRQACLNIALECTVHTQDEVRAKAIRLVANKLYVLSYISETIEQFAKDKLLSLVDKGVQEVELTPQGPEQRIDVGSQDTSTSGILNLEPAPAETGSVKDAQSNNRSTANISLAQAQRYASLFFALCTKKASLLQVVFDIYGKSPKAVKQSMHRHIPALIRNMGASFSDLLQIISDPPEGSENLLMLVLQILTEEMTPSADLIATVKHLYETKLKDAAILIPLLSSLSKNEVLPIFPQLVDLPMEKFQTALARILEGSAHTGPALTPAEVLIAIHDINPEKDGVPLKKIMDACTACFEQRTVFTQQVLAKSLNHLVDRTPLPLLFMRTVIQAIDAFPTLVDFIMEILSKLVSKQIWKMPKLWVGFLKCVSQTHPHSFPVLLQLPVQQLEVALSRHPNLKAPLSAHVNQPHIRSTLSRPMLACLGLVSESQQQPHPAMMAMLRAPDASSSSVHGAALT